MADTIKSSSELKIVWDFADDDSRTDAFPNPNADLTDQDIKDLATYAAANQPILGDKAGAACSGIKEAAVVEKSRIDLDLRLLG